MSLTTNKAITLRSTSEIDGQQILSLNATVSTESGSNGSFTCSIMNQSLYDANKEQARKDIAEFLQDIYATEDGLNATAEDDGEVRS